ncbi:sigma 54-interacting transcriptional regulator [Mixta intestinalis]|uniref:Transcriptional regulatory protein DagR n=1 Tax=Mixta intestinalis TaxID=1615494 RepID=A0A6P1Q5Z2_9GAMM|nr:sigma-54-dependent transcriptional regulator [Mixta intestinalis]QHM73861.1 Transcriptional regulatory protein DagR [Mixta intestinalis]
MTRKDNLLNFLLNQTDFFDPHHISEVFTASWLAQRFAMQRNTASHYLNQLVAEGALVKINTRPVCFLHKHSFEQQFFPLSRSEYNSVAELLAEEVEAEQAADHFALLIGHDGSLKKPIEQLKTALFYPDGGLPLLITGESGTGKSYMAQLLHEYAIAQQVIEPDAPFINFNCAQYASNPELLTANLFGYVKGAFTGAVSDKPGAFEAAQGGILFLDEVHRLSAEGQEKLFTWLDRKEIYRLGETAQAQTVQARLIFATTEEIHSTFLTTFIRRIPIQITLPDLESRSQQEKRALMMQFFWREAQRVGGSLRLSPRLTAALGRYIWRGNVGEMKNAVKYSVASAWARQRGQKTIEVTIHDLPEAVMAQLPALAEPQKSTEPVMIDAAASPAWLLRQQDGARLLIQDTQLSVLALFARWRGGLMTWEEMEKRMGSEIELLFDRLIFDHRDSAESSMLLLTSSQVREEFYRLEKRFNLQFNGNCVYALSHYLLHRASETPARLNVELIRQLSHSLEQRYPLLCRFCHEVLSSVTHKLDLQPQRIDALLLILWLQKTGTLSQTQVTRAVILAHGYATASSIANVANRLLKSNLFESFDMPLDVTPEAIASEVMDYIDRNALATGLVILVDMGSLNAIHQHFNRHITTPVAIINNVSTRMALYVGERILRGDYPEAIVGEVAADLPIEHQLIWPQQNKPRAIITLCATGLGAASNLSALLKASIPEALAIEMVACDYDSLIDKPKRAALLARYEVLAVVGTLDPHLPVPWISLESLISGQGSAALNRLFGGLASSEQVEEINNLIVKNFSLRRVIESVTILDTGKVINQVEQFLLRYEHLAGLQLTNDRKVALYIHISCLIERLIRQTAIQRYAGPERPLRQLNPLREAFSVIEASYSVKIPDAELCYIHDILHRETEFTSSDQEF